MKKLILLILFMSTSICFGQISLITRYTPNSKIIFRDGSSVTGFVKIDNFNRVKFKKDKKDKKEVYQPSAVYRVYFDGNNGEIKEFIIEKGYSHYEIYDVISEGYLTLYSKTYTYNNMHMGPNGQMMGGGTSSSTSYYIKRKFEEEATFFLSFGSIPPKRFKKVVRDYFKDCPALVEKVNNKEFKKKHMDEIVAFYNQNCNPYKK